MTAFGRRLGRQGGGRATGDETRRHVERFATATAVVLAAELLVGTKLLRLPAAVAAAALLGAARRRRSSGRSSDEAEGHARARPVSLRRPARAANRAREEAPEREAHGGGSHPEPEVIEVKSPAELEPGVASATPRPTFSNRVDRGSRGERTRRAPRKRVAGPREGERRSTPAGSRDVSPGGSYLAPDAGAGVREGDLGAVSGPDAEPSGGGDEAARGDPDERD